MKKLQVYSKLKQKVDIFYNQLKLQKFESTTGRKLKVKTKEIITLALYKSKQGIETKKAVWKDFLEGVCSYKSWVVNCNRFSLLALLMLKKMLEENRKQADLVKFTDSTDVPVCLNKNAKYHKTMDIPASWGHSGKGLYYGLKLHITTDIGRKLLSFSFTSANVDDRKAAKKSNKGLNGIFFADAGYVGSKFAEEFNSEERIIIAKPRKNMKVLAAEGQNDLYDKRMTIELSFRSLKMFHGLVTSLPRSIDGYLGNYIYAITSYLL